MNADVRGGFVLLCALGCASPFHGSEGLGGSGRDDAGGLADARRDAATRDAAPPDASRPSQIDGCMLTFSTVADGVLPSTFPPAWVNVQGAVDTAANSRCLDGVTSDCVIFAKDVQVAAGGLRVTGNRNLLIVTTGDITIDGRLDLSGDDATVSGAKAGAGVDCGGAGTSTNGGKDYGGGGNADYGGDGVNGAGGGEPIPPGNRCAGGRGGGSSSGTSSWWGHPGGFVQLISLCGAIRINGTIDASGGGGLDFGSDGRGGGGGGAGGTVALQARTIVFGASGGVLLDGGGGSGGSCSGAGTGALGLPGMGRLGGGQQTCANGWKGGKGGDGGTGTAAPQPGGPGVNGTPNGSWEGGAGGGSRGRLLLLSESNMCAALATKQTGDCVFMGLKP